MVARLRVASWADKLDEVRQRPQCLRNDSLAKVGQVRPTGCEVQFLWWALEDLNL